ncbi:MAG: carbamoyltransferase HypF [Acidobacteria bacterium]|uniref:Carbamoyltransferase n=1 Tax=Candidatus Polarisedimenticola svalbardensis TaxID=2886004 RepID=A0A8J7C2J5_9BACT|nr:carbamoyltransferase HypF [Candidatus Polarisedimenticola svalbardensis]
MVRLSRTRQRFIIRGIVQGVGFRPFAYRTARNCGLAGFVRNDGNGVTLEIEGRREDLQRFHEALKDHAPPLARITAIETEELLTDGGTGFRIVTTGRDGTATTLISPDVSLCADCRAELLDPANQRYRYPFINCTNCGPRFTIVSAIPYDRPNTSMAVFPMCTDCAAEYNDPDDRRFHAQPNACQACGPSLTLVTSDGIKVESGDPITETIRLLGEGKILAVRGLGGFHLVVDAHNDNAVRELRKRKGRGQKPFALMAPDTDTVERYCKLESEERVALEQPTRPIVLLRAKPDSGLAPSVAPGNRYLGFMLPYAPLHELLLDSSFPALVMTSGNLSEEPIAIGNAEALDRLGPLADYLLLHDREILQRCDDSIVRVAAGKERMIRRARGYVPMPVFLPSATTRNILATGAELKNTIGLTREDHVFLSQHIGDLDNPAALAFFQHTVGHLGSILQIEPELIAHDLHPEYLSTKWAMEQAGLPRIAVQHHHAHLAAVMAENGVTGPCIGLILDGTGYGTDGTVWGGEILTGDFAGFQRHAWLETVPMPGGSAAIREPWRMALSWLRAAFGDEALALPLPVRERFGDGELLFQAMDQGVNAPLTSSCGRLFDAVSSILDLRHEISFEAQAAIELEMSATDVPGGEAAPYELSVPSGAGPVPVTPLIQAVVRDTLAGVDTGMVAARFHASLAKLLAETVMSVAREAGIDIVGLSGGVFQNQLFFNEVLTRLRETGLQVLTHSLLPAGDGCIALGQAVVASEQSK